MNTNQAHPARAPRASVWALGLLGLALSACGGGGGGGGSGSSVQVLGVAPGAGPFGGGTAVTVEGRAFDPLAPNEVLFGGVAATDVLVLDEHTLTCRTPAGTPGALVDVVVRNGRGEGRKSAAFLYSTPAQAQSDLNGDGIADLVVAAPADAGPGAVYVFFGRDPALDLDGLASADADVRLAGESAGDGFGACVCGGDVDGDGFDDLIVGANKVDLVGAADAGAAYVFRGPLSAGSALLAQDAFARLTGSVAVPGDEFGAALELGDLDADGVSDLMVAAPRHDVGAAPDAGCVYVFRGGATLASRSADAADMALDGALDGERLGERMACGDVDGDGAADLVLAAPLADVQQAVLLRTAGRVIVQRGGMGAPALAPIVLTGAQPGDRFGSSVVVADLDGDGVLDLVVGAPNNDAGDAEAGRVYVFRGGAALANGDADTADFAFTGVPTQGSVGRTLRAGDVNGDGVADLLVGAPLADYLNSQNGRAFLFLGGPALASLPVVGADATFVGEVAEGDAFSTGLSLLDVNGDGYVDVAGGSPVHGGTGRVYVWLGGADALVGLQQAAQCDVVVTGTQAAGRFGEALAPGL